MRKIIANIGWIFFDKIFRMAAGILVGVWIARYLGPSDFGILNYAILFPTLFSAIAGFGLTNILMVEYVAAGNDAEKRYKLVNNGLIIKLLGGILMYCVVAIINYIANRNNPVLFILINITGTALILQSSDVFDTYFQSQTKAKLSVFVKFIAFIIATCIRIYALLSHQNLLFFAVINCVELILGYGLVVGAYRHYTGRLIYSISQLIDVQMIRHLLNIAWPIMLTEFFVFLYMRVDQFMIESLSTNRELGLYSAALRLSEAWYFVCIAITTSFYPKIASLWDTDRLKFYNDYQQVLNLLVYISVSVALITNFCADIAIQLLYGPKFQGAGAILSIHIWAGVFVFIGVGTNNLMIVENLQKFVLIKTIAGALLNILLNIWLIPKFGALGSSVATLMSYSLQAYGMNIINKKSRHIFNLQSKSFVNLLMFKKPMKITIN